MQRSWSRWSLLVPLLAASVPFLNAGCSPDLRRVHTPELLADPKPPSPHKLPKVTTEARVPPTCDWTIYSSLNPPEVIADGNFKTVAVAPLPDSRDQFILIDLGQECTLGKVTQIHPGECVDGFPARYRIDSAGSHNFPYSLVWVGSGTPGSSVAVLARPITCRFLRITLMEPTGTAWAISDLVIE